MQEKYSINNFLISLVAFCLFFIILILGCNDDKRVSESKSHDTDRLSKIYALPISVISPPGNQMTEAKVKLGRLLFFDPILSGEKDVACATCHHPSNGFAESRDLSIGVNGSGFGGNRAFKEPNQIPFVKRNAHTVLNTAYNGIDLSAKYDPEEAPMFWDDRVKSLEGQALEPLKALEEMRGMRYSESEILDVVVARLQEIGEYEQLFSLAFPTDPEPVSIDNLAKAIAAYERTLVSNNSRFDAFKRGDENALSEAEKEGMQTFLDVGCAKCHNGPMFSDYQMHVLGVPDNPKLAERDLGFELTNAFRTASLRNLRFTFPFMHNGSMKSIKEILEFYEDIANGKSRNPHIPIEDIDPLARSLKLKVKDFGPITNFLLSLNDDNFDQSIPETVPSKLPVGGEVGL
ncbi:MAG: cytochrome-c peroxidase [Saprospiraceae bacterium]|nr:cytochrome-c peroxidase [Saprospiraceae bacterium]